MVYHTRSKGSLPSFPTKNRKGKVKATNAKVMCKTIEKKCLLDELVSNLEKKIKKLEEEWLDMCEWAKLLLPPIPLWRPTWICHLRKSSLQNNPPPDYFTYKSLPSSI